MAIVYGVYERQQRQLEVSSVADIERKATPATGASHDVTSKIPAGDVPVLKPNVALLEDQTRAAADETPGQSSRNLTAGPGPRMRSIAEPLAGPLYQNEMERAEDRENNLAYQREQEAILAPTPIGGGRNNGGAASPAYAVPVSAPNASIPQTFNGSSLGTTISAIPTGEASRVGLGGVSQTGEYNAQNGQDEKTAFLARARNRVPQNYLPSVRTAPGSRFEIKTGWDIPTTLEQAINSDQPGEIKALVRENVYDTATGRYVLIPQGSRLVGSYNSTVSYGQDGVQAVWDRVIFPDASSLDLNGMIGQDARGESGLRYAVDHHYARLVGFAVLTSLFSAGFQLSQNRPGTILAQPSPGEVIAGAVGGQVSQLGVEITRRNLNVQPTIKVPAGYRFNVRVNRDIIFDAPYTAFR
jgi:type IV secretion system protein VirB10